MRLREGMCVRVCGCVCVCVVPKCVYLNYNFIVIFANGIVHEGMWRALRSIYLLFSKAVGMGMGPKIAVWQANII